MVEPYADKLVINGQSVGDFYATSINLNGRKIWLAPPQIDEYDFFTVVKHRNGGETIKAKETALGGQFYLIKGVPHYVVKNNTDMTRVVNLFKTTAGTDVQKEVVGDNESHTIRINQVITTFVTNMNAMFQYATNFNQNIENWDVSNVTNMNAMFQSATNFNQDIGNWDVSNVTLMSYMFQSATNFNQDIGNWDVSNVTLMSYMFQSATNFNQDLSNWCVQNIPSLPSNFSTGTNVWTLPKPEWGYPAIKTVALNLGMVKYELRPHAVGGRYYQLGGLYYYLAKDRTDLIRVVALFENDAYVEVEGDDLTVQIPLNQVLTHLVTDMSYLFADSNINQDINKWETKQVTDMTGMFFNNTNFNQPLDLWDTQNCKLMAKMFKGASAFNQDLRMWDVHRITYKPSEFNEGTNWDVNKTPNWGNRNFVFQTDFITKAKETALGGQFYLIKGVPHYVVKNNTDMTRVVNLFKTTAGTDVQKEVVGDNESHTIRINQVITTFVTNMNAMFQYATNFNQNIENWDVSNVTNMNAMFQSATNFNQDIGNWDVSNVTLMSYMFQSATNFNQDIGNWDVSNVTLMSYMFQSATNFNQDLSNWCVQNIPSLPSQFSTGTNVWTLPKPEWGTCP